jgi:acetylornithine deacetylase/succinyl-diaminopimelate desuccinylase-like protein
MEDINMKVSTPSKNRKRKNVIGRYGIGKKTLIVACHMDTVPAGLGWKSNPFRAKIVGDKIFGRGAIDDKGPLAISYCAIRSFVNKNPDFDGRILLIALADEETNNKYGIKYLLKKGLVANSALIPDGGYFNSFDYGEKGCVQVEIECFGKQEHSALSKGGVNAIENILIVLPKIVNKVENLNHDKRFTKTKVNISKISGGGIANTTAPKAYTQMDIRFPLGIKSKNIIKIINNVLKSHSNNKVKFSPNILYTTEPHIVDDKKLLNSFNQAARVLNIPMKKITISGNSVAKEFTLGGIPAIAHYPMNKITAHEPNEYISINDMIKTVSLYEKFLEIYFNTKKRR